MDESFDHLSHFRAHVTWQQCGRTNASRIARRHWLDVRDGLNSRDMNECVLRTISRHQAGLTLLPANGSGGAAAREVDCRGTIRGALA
jgi:hypothetical protein